MLNKILLCVLLVMSSVTLSAQRDSVVFGNDLFFGIYSEVYQQPLTLSYTVMCPNGDASRYGMDFYVNDSVITSDNEDYRNNVWDKGHIAPAAAFNCDLITLYKTFSYLNCSLQHQNLNRGLWRSLESYERKLALCNKVFVVVDLVFSEKSEKLETGAVVPDGFKKSVYVNDTLTGSYYFPNTPTIKGVTFDYYKIQ